MIKFKCVLGFQGLQVFEEGYQNLVNLLPCSKMML